MSVNVRAGDMRQRIVIQSRTDSQDTYGESDPTWGTLATVYAAVEPGIGSEFLGAGIELDAQPHTFRFRYSSDTSAVNCKTHRISWNSQTFDLVSVQNEEGRNHSIVAVGVVRG